MKKIFRIFSLNTVGLVLLCFSQASSLSAQSEAPPVVSSPWTSDFQQAKKIAVAEKKDMALLFTASDWLDLAKTFDQEILSQQAFLNLASSHYSLVKLDFPKDVNLQSKQTTTQNQLLMQAYRVRGLPTLILTDELGRPYAITGYHDGGLNAWLEEFNQLRQTREKRDRLFAKAKNANGVERAQLLSQGMPDLPGNIAARFYRNIMNEVIQLDPENQTGRVIYFQTLIADVKYADQMQQLTVKGNDKKMLALSDHYLKIGNLSDSSRQGVLFNKLSIYEKQGNSTQVSKTLQEIISVAPDSPQGKQAASLLEKIGSSAKKSN